QRRRPLIIGQGSVVFGTGQGGAGVAVVVDDGGGGRRGIRTTDRRKAAVAGDGDGAVVGWGGVEQRCHLLGVVLGEGARPACPQGSRPSPGCGAARPAMSCAGRSAWGR